MRATRLGTFPVRSATTTAGRPAAARCTRCNSGGSAWPSCSRRTASPRASVEAMVIATCRPPGEKLAFGV